MMRYILAALILAVAVPAPAQSPSYLWSKAFGDVGEDFGHALAVDAAGNTIMTGVFPGTVNFGGSTLTSSGSWDVFLVKFAPDGTHLWSQRFGDAPQTAADQIAYDVAVDPAGNIYVTGACAGTSNFGGANLVGAGGYDIFLAKYNAGGTHQWSTRFGGGTHDYGYGVVANASGVVITGSFAVSVNFGGGAQASAGSNDIFVARFDGNGVFQWSRTYGVSGSDVGEELAFDSAGNVLVTGRVAGSVNFGGGALTFLGTSDVFLLKLTPAGAHVWSKGVGGGFFDAGTAVAVDGSDNVIVTGEFSSSANFGGSTIVGNPTNRDVFLAKYTSGGAHLWSKGFAGTGFDKPYAVAAGADGDIALAGHYGNIQGAAGYTIDLGGATLASNGESDIFMAGFDASGNHRWSDGFGGPTVDDARDIVFDASGNILLTGSFQQSVTFLWPTLNAVGLNEIFLAKYSTQSAEPAIQSIVDVGNDQGRSVKIAFSSSGLDGAARSVPVVRYDAYRRDDPPPAVAAGAGDSRALVPADAGWQYVGSVPAHGEAGYLMRAPTLADSTVTDGMFHSVFFVRAVTEQLYTFFDSAPDSGWSLDNLSPGAPQNFAYAAGRLSWAESAAPDFDHFTVYGSDTDAFAAAVVVDYGVAPVMDVSDAPYAFYFVTATDAAGNESKPAGATALSGVGGTPQKYVLSASNFPNPFNPSTTVRYTVPSRGAVTVAIHDARGVRVATLFDGVRDAGAYSVTWDGRTEAAVGAASGIYFVRIDHDGATRSKKMVLLK